MKEVISLWNTENVANVKVTQECVYVRNVNMLIYIYIIKKKKKVNDEVAEG